MQYILCISIERERERENAYFARMIHYRNFRQSNFKLALWIFYRALSSGKRVAKRKTGIEKLKGEPIRGIPRCILSVYPYYFQGNAFRVFTSHFAENLSQYS